MFLYHCPEGTLGHGHDGLSYLDQAAQLLLSSRRLSAHRAILQQHADGHMSGQNTHFTLN